MEKCGGISEDPQLIIKKKAEEKEVKISRQERTTTTTTTTTTKNKKRVSIILYIQIQINRNNFFSYFIFFFLIYIVYHNTKFTTYQELITIMKRKGKTNLQNQYWYLVLHDQDQNCYCIDSRLPAVLSSISVEN